MRAADLPRCPLADKFLHGAIVPANGYQHTKFQLPSSNSFRDKEGVPKFNVALLHPCLTPYAETFTCAPSTWQDKTASQISASYLYASCSYAICHRLTIVCAQKWFFGGFEGEDVKILCSNPQKALPCVNTRLLVYRVSKLVQQLEL